MAHEVSESSSTRRLFRRTSSLACRTADEVAIRQFALTRSDIDALGRVTPQEPAAIQGDLT